MPLSWNQIMDNAIRFSKKFENVVREEADGKSFQREFIELFGVKDAREVGSFEYRVSKDDSRKGYIDYLWPGKIAIEMKSSGKDLKQAYAQLKEYVVHLNTEDIPNVLMICDFKNIHLYIRTTDKQVKFKTKDLYKYVKYFSDISGYESTRLYDNQEEVNIKASVKMTVPLSLPIQYVKVRWFTSYGLNYWMKILALTLHIELLNGVMKQREKLLFIVSSLVFQITQRVLRKYMIKSVKK